MLEPDPFADEWRQTEVDGEAVLDKIKVLQWAETKTQPMDPVSINALRAECVAIHNRRIDINLKRLKIWREGQEKV